MKKSLRTSPRTKLSARWIIAASSAFMLIVAVLIILNMGKSERAYASTNETMSSGSYIINTGITPQTFNNALKPYGMIYDLVQNYNIPVKWIIEPTKAKDGTDFTYGGVDYKGGPFIIPAEFITPAIASVIATWNAKGVQGVYTTSSVDVPVYTTITSYPKVMIDTLSTLQAIIAAYYSSADVPATAYTLGTPSSLTECYDLWTNPHGDPTWATHSALYNFVTVQKSFIWAECHSVSMMESCKNPLNPLEGLNFLSTLGLQCYQSSGSKCPGIPESHLKSSSSPYIYSHSADPVMQFMGNMHEATKIGSEQWYIPYSLGQWRPNVNRGVSTATGSDPREGTILVYGPAFGDPANGYVMYEAGHDLLSTGSTENRVAAARAYHNFVLLAGKLKQLSATLTTAASVQPGGTANAIATPTGGTPPYTYEWTANMGSFNVPTYQAVLYTAPYVETDTTVVLKVVITDACNRKNILYKYFPISGGALPVELTSFSAKRNGEGVDLKWATASEKDNDFFTVERSDDGKNFSPVMKVLGQGNTHSEHSYSVTDKNAPSTLLYYKLRQTDIDGTTAVFKIISVKNSSEVSGTIRTAGPNPFNDHFVLTIESEEKQEVTVSIYTQQGQLVESCNFNVDEGSNALTVYTSGSVQKGIYIVRVTGKNSDFGMRKMSKL